MGSLPLPRLPVHGFVLAGGGSSRMGEDKALLRFCGQPMVEIAVEKLRDVCMEVGIAGNREDLARFAPVVREKRLNAGPAAGIEAGLKAGAQPWVMFVPVDVPLAPARLLRRWAKLVLEKEGVLASHLRCGRDQPAFCMLRRECAERLSQALDTGERRLEVLLRAASEDLEWVLDVAKESPMADARESWFANVNTREDLAAAEELALGGGKFGA